MANLQKGEVGFKALGREFTMRFGINALCELEDRFGKSAVEVANDLNGEAVSVGSLRAVIWCGLQEYHEDLTEKDVGRIIDDLGIEEVGPLLGRAFQAAFPDTPDGSETQAAGKPKSRAKARP